MEEESELEIHYKNTKQDLVLAATNHAAYAEISCFLIVVKNKGLN